MSAEHAEVAEQTLLLRKTHLTFPAGTPSCPRRTRRSRNRRSFSAKRHLTFLARAPSCPRKTLRSRNEPLVFLRTMPPHVPASASSCPPSTRRRGTVPRACAATAASLAGPRIDVNTGVFCSLAHIHEHAELTTQNSCGTRPSREPRVSCPCSLPSFFDPDRSPLTEYSPVVLLRREVQGRRTRWNCGNGSSRI
jgi:hypothetical protein